MAMRKLQLVAANDGSYGGAVLAAFDTQTAEEADRLAHEMARDSAVCIIETNTHLRGGSGESLWHDISPHWLDPYASEPVLQAAHYLELRGLLEHHAEYRNWVRVKEAVA